MISSLWDFLIVVALLLALVGLVFELLTRSIENDWEDSE